MKSKFNWECAANHYPAWIDKLDSCISAVMPIQELNAINKMLSRYNELTKREESNNEDGFSLHGIEDEKEGIINDIVKLMGKYKEEAIKLKSN